MKNSKTALLAAAALASAVTAPLAGAAGNPFSNTQLASGFNLQPYEAGSGGAEGKCGVDPKVCPEGKCGEGKCGEKCRGEHDDEGKHGDDKKADDAHKGDAEGKCGEGKCGAM